MAPLFRWAGGKQRFLWDHRELLPSFSGRYFEPFAGGLSIYFHYVRDSLTPFQAIIGDVNLRLVRTYTEIKKDPSGVVERLAILRAGYDAATDKSAFYYDVRETHNSRSPKSDAARFIFLMAAGWNGVFRLNNRGQFNVPHGSPRSLKLPSIEQLHATSTVFQTADIRATSWESTIHSAQPGDFVFLDPPYGVASRKDLYGRKDAFGWSDQLKLAAALGDLQRRGVNFLLTNSAEPQLVDAYQRQGLNVRVIEAQRSIAASADSRGSEKELIVTPNADRGIDTLIGASFSSQAPDLVARFSSDEGEHNGD